MTTLPPSDPAAAAASAAQGATPGTSELTQFAPQVPGVPDAATIARLANAFYSGAPSSPMPGPGAALPSAPVFAAEPIYNSLPGVPALQLPLSPNLNPGLPPFPFPASGAAQPSAPVFAVEPLIAQATSAPTPGAVAPVRRQGRTGRAGRTRSAVWRNSSCGSTLRSGRLPERGRSRVAPIYAWRRDVVCAELRARARRDARRPAKAPFPDRPTPDRPRACRSSTAALPRKPARHRSRTRPQSSI